MAQALEVVLYCSCPCKSRSRGARRHRHACTESDMHSLALRCACCRQGSLPTLLETLVPRHGSCSSETGWAEPAHGDIVQESDPHLAHMTRWLSFNLPGLDLSFPASLLWLPTRHCPSWPEVPPPCDNILGVSEGCLNQTQTRFRD